MQHHAGVHHARFTRVCRSELHGKGGTGSVMSLTGGAVRMHRTKPSGKGCSLAGAAELGREGRRVGVCVCGYTLAVSELGVVGAQRQLSLSA